MTDSRGGQEAGPASGNVLRGLLLIAAGVLVNAWAVERVLASDHRIESSLARGLILAFQVGCVGLGVWCLVRRGAFRLPGWASSLLWMVAVGAAVGGGILSTLAADVARVEEQHRRDWAVMNASEDVIQWMATVTPRLKTSVHNLELPDPEARRLFDETVVVRAVGAGEAEHADDHLAPLGVRRRHWNVDPTEHEVSRDDLQLWEPVFSEIAFFRHASFKTVLGRFLDEEQTTYEVDMAFSGLAETTSGEVLSLHSQQAVRWRRVEPAAGAAAEETGDSSDNWVITHWLQEDMHGEVRDEFLFTEVLDDALPDPVALAIARKAILEGLWDELMAMEGDVFDHPRELSRLYGGTSPGIAVVDLDRDGDDDLFVSGRDDAMYLRSRGDGTFEDATATLGVDAHESASATFADFDNDGDADLFLGRNMEPSAYYLNEDGTLRDRSADMVEGHMPWLVSSTAAADYDNDGLLDLYVSTYGFSPLGYESRFKELRTGPHLLGAYLTPDDAARLHALLNGPEHNLIINSFGPPNVLFRNAGDGRLVEAEHPGARVNRNSFQSTWADYDQDGDQDLYVSNDFAPNNLLRNDGDGVFVDIAEETGTEDIGFGMGVTWGDYDHDGRQDLYVTNMYSKAGRRVLSQYEHVDERLKLMYRGNSLYRNGPDGFEKVSGVEAPAMLVEKGGWGWGSQFVDVDGDGFQDLYALSGMITAPKKYEQPVDI